MYETWSASGHARAGRSEVFAAMRRRVADPAACDRCHAPLRAVLPRGDPVVEDGVTCEVCHRMTAAKPAPSGGRVGLDLGAKRMRGTLCDAKAPYFHTIACEPLLASADVCGACHWLAEPAPAFTSFAEWRRDAESGPTCQTCHMGGSRGPIASGASRRERVPDHGPPRAGEAIAWSTRWELAPGRLRVLVELRNTGAAHAVPAGLPGRALEVSVEARGPEGALLGEDRRSLRRVLVDASGREVPFYAATREAEDTRLAAGETRALELGVPLATSGPLELRVRLGDRALAPAIAAQLELPAPAPTIVREASFHVDVPKDMVKGP